MDPNGWIAPCQLPAEGWRTVSYLEDSINFNFRNWLSGHISQSCQSGQENSFRDLLIFIHFQQLHTWQGPSACIKQHFGSQKLCIPFHPWHSPQKPWLSRSWLSRGAILGRSFLSQEGMTTIHRNPPQPAAHHQCHTSVASVHPELFWPSVIQNSCWETNITMENHHFQWENPLYNSYVKLPEVITITGLTKIVFQSQLVESKWTWVARSKICSNIIRFFQMLRHLFSTAPCASGMIWHDGAAWEMKSRQAPKTDPWRRWHMKPAMAWGATLPSGCGSKLGPPKNDHGSFLAESSKFEIENWEFWPMPLSL